ncbi:hypothetical protein TherJR_1905 [Thermincola potens JR]|uniref:Uncharacterized protein n=1 Tax=Thermincola potens (strain JR) TaxID=635013 RepID=D5X834_THEPJ|nr:hypothetical protein TherJR_1905 [Thermincola potens JR]
MLKGLYTGSGEAGSEFLCRKDESRYKRGGTLQPTEGPAAAGNQGGTAKQTFRPWSGFALPDERFFSLKFFQCLGKGGMGFDRK